MRSAIFVFGSAALAAALPAHHKHDTALSPHKVHAKQEATCNGCTDDPSYFEVTGTGAHWGCSVWAGWPCSAGDPPVTGDQKIERLKQCCPVTCMDATPVCDAEPPPPEPSTPPPPPAPPGSPPPPSPPSAIALGFINGARDDYCSTPALEWSAALAASAQDAASDSAASMVGAHRILSETVTELSYSYDASSSSAAITNPTSGPQYVNRWNQAVENFMWANTNTKEVLLFDTLTHVGCGDCYDCSSNPRYVCHFATSGGEPLTLVDAEGHVHPSISSVHGLCPNATTAARVHASEMQEGHRLISEAFEHGGIAA